MVVLKVLREFAGGTSIHGFTFLVRPESSSRTKIIWAIAIVVALSYASWEMKNSVISKYYCVFRAMKYKQFIIITYSSVPNRRACTFINFEKKIPPARPYLGLHVY